MKFTRIKLENWRNFRSVNQDLRERVFVIGPNAAGKTNFLDAFQFLKDICEPVGGGFQQAVAARLGMTHLRSLLARENPDILIEVWIEDSPGKTWRYKLAFGQKPKEEILPAVRAEELEGPGGVAMTPRPEPSEKTDPEQLQQTLLENKSRNQQFRPLISFFKSIQYCHVVPSLIRSPRPTEKGRKDFFGSDFLGIIAEAPTKERSRRLGAILKAMKTIVPHISKLTMERDERGVPHLQAKYEHWRPQGSWQNEADLSDGTLRLIGFLWALQEKTGPLLLEEPEHSLHAEVVRLLPQIFARVGNVFNRQIFVSTHSLDLLNDPGISPDEILRLETTSDGTVVKSVGNDQNIVRLYESGIPLGEAASPYTRPPDSDQLIFSFEGTRATR